MGPRCGPGVVTSTGMLPRGEGQKAAAGTGRPWVARAGGRAELVAA